MSDIINTQNCIIRTVELEDAEALLEISNSVISEGDYFIIVSEELEEKSLKQQREQIQEVLNNENENLIVAEINDVVVGSIVFRSHNLKRLSHTGSISMSISENYRGMGFVEEGRKLKEFKINENKYVDDILMYKFV